MNKLPPEYLLIAVANCSFDFICGHDSLVVNAKKRQDTDELFKVLFERHL